MHEHRPEFPVPLVETSRERRPVTALAQLRSEFPLFRDFTWLNAAASSPTATSVLAAMERYLRQTAESGDLEYPAWARFRDTVRARLATFIGAAPSEVAFVPSTSFGFSIIAHLLKAQGQTEVLTLEGEFPSTTLPLLHAGLTLRWLISRRRCGRPRERWRSPSCNTRVGTESICPGWPRSVGRRV
jgi:selenocysteine lyase/cysteine desulfurase